MSNSDLVGAAALRALKKETKKPDSRKVAADSSTGSTTSTKSYSDVEVVTEADARRVPVKSAPATERTARPQPTRTRLPEKGSAEAAAHRMAAEQASKSSTTNKSTTGNSKVETDPNSGNIGFLLAALAAPLLLVVGLFGYASYKEQPKQTAASPTTPTAAKSPVAAATTTTPAAPATTAPAANSAPTKAVAKAPTAAPAPQAIAAAPAAPAAAAPTHTAPAAPAAPAGGKSVGSGAEWGYDGAKGPDNWATLSPAYKACGNGQRQSPVDIPLKSDKTGPIFQYDYRATTADIVNNGHTVKVNLTSNNRLLVNGKSYALKQFHFHTPSENHLNGRSFPMEVQLVHTDRAGNIVVVAVMVEKGGVNPLLARLPVPQQKGQKIISEGASIDATLLLPANRTSFTFSGSLTTPPCTENVGWVVMRTPIRISYKSLKRFKKAMGDNNRPLQLLNNRAFYRGN